MHCHCTCDAVFVRADLLCLQHIFYTSPVPIVTTMYYSPTTDLDTAKADCHKVSLATTNKLLERYGVVIEEM